MKAQFRRMQWAAITAVTMALAGGVHAQGAAAGGSVTVPTPGTPSAEPTTFVPISQQLDAGGSFYLIMDTQTMLTGLDTWLGKVFTAISSGQPAGQQRDDLERASKVVQRILRDSGATEVAGVGMSSYATAPGNYYNKVVMQHLPGKDKGLMWHTFGEQPHALDDLAMMPAGTALAYGTDLNLSQVWDWLNALAADSQIPEFQQQLAATAKALQDAQVDPKLLFASLSHGLGMALILDDSAMVNIPGPKGRSVAIPTPYLVIFAKVPDEQLYTQLSQLLKDKKAPVVVADQPEGKVIGMPGPLPLPVPVQPALIQAPGYLFITSHPEAVWSMLKVRAGKAPGLTSTDEYKKIAAGIPTTGNAWSYLSPRFAAVLQQYQQMAIEDAATPEAGEALKALMSKQLAYSFGVAQVTATGHNFVSNASLSGPQQLLVMEVGVAAIAAGMILPIVSKSRDQAKTVASANNLRQVGLGLQAYAEAHNGNFPQGDGVVGLNELLTGKQLTDPKLFVATGAKQVPAAPGTALTEANCSYLYVGGGLVDNNPDLAFLPLALDKTPNAQGRLTVLFGDGHVEPLNGRFNSLTDIMQVLLQRGKFTLPASKTWLLDKGHALDAQRKDLGY